MTLLRRVIPCLDVDKGRVVKGTEFVNIRDAGDPVELATFYEAEGADELVFLDITASHEGRDTIVDLARRTADDLFIPFTIGGGIRSVDDAQAVLGAGADKVSVNSAAVARPELLSELAAVFGAQCVVLAIDARRRDDGDGYEVYVSGGRKPTGLDAVEWARRGVELGAGEILLTSMDRDGTEDGYELDAHARGRGRRRRARDRFGRGGKARAPRRSDRAGRARTRSCAHPSSTTAPIASARPRSACAWPASRFAAERRIPHARALNSRPMGCKRILATGGGVLACSLVAAAAASGAVGDLASIRADYRLDSSITRCRFTLGELESARVQVAGNPDEAYSNFAGVLDGEIARLRAKFCRGAVAESQRKKSSLKVNVKSVVARGGTKAERVRMRNKSSKEVSFGKADIAKPQRKPRRAQGNQDPRQVERDRLHQLQAEEPGDHTRGPRLRVFQERAPGRQGRRAAPRRRKGRRRPPARLRALRPRLRVLAARPRSLRFAHVPARGDQRSPRHGPGRARVRWPGSGLPGRRCAARPDPWRTQRRPRRRRRGRCDCARRSRSRTSSATAA